jgi:RNA polymerase sigma factor (sigma-70 family)
MAVQNSLKKYLKQRRRNPYRHGYYVDPDRLEDAQVDLTRFEEDDLLRAVRALEAQHSAEDRELLDLRYQQGLEPSEIANIIGVLPATARKRLQRATDRLRRIVLETEKSVH